MSVSLTQSYSFSSQPDQLSSSQWAQNSTSDDEEAVRRVTIRQLLNSVPTNEELPFQYKLNGIGIKRVILVANIQDRGATPGGRKWYMLDDGTGRIKLYLNGSEDPKYNYDDFEYTRVVGILGDNYKRKSVSAINLAPIHNPHEVYFHILHAMVDATTYEKGPPPWGLVPPVHDQPMESLSQAFQNATISSEIEAPSTSRQSPQPNSSNGRIKVRSRLEREIIMFIADNSDDGHVSLEDIVDHIRMQRPNIDSAATLDAMVFLLKENIITTADDEEHYQLAITF